MSTQLHTIQKLGYLPEASQGVDPITDTYYKFGRALRTIGQFPAQKYNPHVTNRGGTRDPYDIRVTYQGGGNLAYAPVNGLGLYRNLGSSVTTAGVHRLVGINDGSLPTNTLRYQTESVATARRRSLVGAKSKTYLFRIDQQPKTYASAGEVFLGERVVTPTTTTDITPTFQDSEDTPYLPDGNFKFLWGVTLDGNNEYSSGGTDYSNDWISGNIIFDSFNRFQRVASQNYPKWVLEMDRSTILQFSILRGDDHQIADDYDAQISNAFNDAHIKIYNSGTNYFQIDLKDVVMISCDENFTNENVADEDAVWDVSAVVKSVVGNIKDGVAVSHYGE